MRRFAGVLGVAMVALLPGCAEDRKTMTPSESAKTREAGAKSLLPSKATDDDTFAEARADAVPLIRKAMDELDEVSDTATTGSNLGHVADATDLVQQACFIFDGVDDEIAGYLCSAADHLLAAANAIGGSPKAPGATHELRAAAGDIDAANALLALPITT